jgi:hypothetical protein
MIIIYELPTISSLISFTESISEINPEIFPAGRIPKSIFPSNHDFSTEWMLKALAGSIEPFIIFQPMGYAML